MPLFRTIALLFSGTFFLFFSNCNVSTEIVPDLSDGNGSGVGVGFVSGLLYEPDGTTPAREATLVVRDKNQTALVAAGGAAKNKNALYTAFTNDEGIFSFDTITDGLYIIEGSDNKGNMVLYDSILIQNPAAPRTLPDATLQPAGTITGTITLTDDGNYLQVFILAFGIDHFSQVQPDGTFSFPQLAAGTYTLKILSLDPLYETVDTAGIEVKSGETNDIGTIILPRQETQPVPEIITSYYDSILTNVTLTWKSLPDSITAGYNIYRTSIENGSTYQRVIRLNGESLHKDTSFTDNTLYNHVTGNSTIDTVKYIVTMVDLIGNESQQSSTIIVPIVTAWEQYNTISISIPQAVDIVNAFLGNDEITCISENHDWIDDTICWQYSLFRFSLDGGQTQSVEIPVSCSENLNLRGLNRDTDAKNFWFLINKSPDLSESGAEHLFDSVFVYALSPSGEFTRQVWIPPREDTASIDAGGIVIQRDLYYRVDNDRIRRINLDTGEDEPFLDLNNEDARIRSLIPGPDGGFIVGVFFVNQTYSLVERHDCIFFDTDGNEIKTVSFPRINGIIDFNDKRSLLASDGTTFYFERFFARIETDGTISWDIMPLHRFNHPVIVRDDGTIIVLKTGYEEGVLKFYRLKNSNLQ